MNQILKIYLLILLSICCLCGESMDLNLLSMYNMAEMFGILPDADLSELSELSDEGKLVTYFKNDKYFVLALLLEEQNSLVIGVLLYSVETKEALDAGNGIYVGLGFSGSETGNTDAVVFTYKNNKGVCEDYWGPTEVLKKTLVLEEIMT
jgi:hypothetical protein